MSNTINKNTDDITCDKSKTPPEEKQETETQHRPKHQIMNLKYFDTSFRNVWFYFAAFALILNLSYTFRPQINIQASASADNDPLGTLFTLSNISPWTLYNIDATCTLFQGSEKIYSLMNNEVHERPETPALGNPRIRELQAGQTATRDCGTGNNSIGIRIGNLDIKSLRINLDVSYDWFFGLMRNNNTRHFNTRLVKGSIVLIPDVEYGVQ
jgi:hypothetical protein